MGIFGWKSKAYKNFLSEFSHHLGELSLVDKDKLDRCRE